MATNAIDVNINYSEEFLVPIQLILYHYRGVNPEGVGVAAPRFCARAVGVAGGIVDGS